MNIFSNEEPNTFSLSSVKNSTAEFLNSNSMVAKLAFLFLVLLVFILLLRIGISIIAWFYSPASSIHFIDGMQEGNQMKRFEQDPSVGGKTTIRSHNEDQGIEFTWSTWIYVNDITNGAGKYRHIFHKGDNPNNIANDGIVYPNNAPGLYLAPNTNALRVVMKTLKSQIFLSINGLMWSFAARTWYWTCMSMARSLRALNLMACPNRTMETFGYVQMEGLMGLCPTCGITTML